MAGISWFQDGTYTRKQLRQLIGALIGGKTAARPLGAHSGLTSPVSLSVTSTTWTVGAFTGILDLETDATMGPSPFAFGTTTTGSVTAASVSIDRWDLLSITMDDATPTAPTIVYTAGTVAATLPATPAESIALAKIVVPKSGTGSPTITLIAPQAAAVGGILPCASSSEYPPAPRVGAYIDDAALGGALKRWNGSAWVYANALSSRQIARTSSINIPSGGSGTPIGTGYADTFNIGGIGYSSGALTADRAGVFDVDWMMRWDTSPAANFIREILVTVNGSSGNVARASQTNPSAITSNLNYQTGSGKLLLAAGDSVQLTAYQNSGSTIAIIEGNLTLTCVVPQ